MLSKNNIVGQVYQCLLRLVVDKMGVGKDNSPLGAFLADLLFILRGLYVGRGRCRDAVG